MDQTRTQLGRFDILGNIAAFQQHQASIEDISDEQLEHTFRTNIVSGEVLAVLGEQTIAG